MLKGIFLTESSYVDLGVPVTDTRIADRTSNIYSGVGETPSEYDVDESEYVDRADKDIYNGTSKIEISDKRPKNILDNFNY